MIRQLVLIVIFFSISESGFEKYQIGARSGSMGGAMTAERSDLWSISANPAGAADIGTFQFGLSYTPKRFSFTEINSTDLAACLPSKFGVFGCILHSYGFELYREMALGFSYGVRLSGLSLGLNLNYYHVSIKRYGSAGTAGCDMGFQVPLSERIAAGLFFRNINSPTIGRIKEKLPQSIAFGINYNPFDYLRILLDIYKETGFLPSLRIGIEYWCSDIFSVRGGVIEYPEQFSGGFGIRDSGYQLDFAAMRHADLGWTYTISISFSKEEI